MAQGGGSVQRADIGAVALTDREMMKKTLLRGESIIFGYDVCDSIKLVPKGDVKAGGGGGGAQDGAKAKRPQRQSLRIAHWVAVMQAGLGHERVGEFDAGKGNPDRRGARVHLHLPVDGDTDTTNEYHNRLMRLCGIGFTTLMQAVAKRGETAARVARKPRRGAAAPSAGGGGPIGRSAAGAEASREENTGSAAGPGGSVASAYIGAMAPGSEGVNPASVPPGPGEF